MKKSKKFVPKDRVYYQLFVQLNKAIKTNQATHGIDQQKEMESLMMLERSFRDYLCKNFMQTHDIYGKFILKIVSTNKNLLTARPFFRARGTTFSKEITPALRNGDVQALQTFDINFLFISFIRSNWKGKFPAEAEALYKAIEDVRRRLVENNMPLAINEAKKFYSKTHRAHLEYTDMIGLCGEGLVSAVDKWTGKYSRVFCSVIMGRGKGNLIEQYSSTFVHLYPVDRRILYKANVIRSRTGITEIPELVKAINESFAKDAIDGKKPIGKVVTEADIFLLLQASALKWVGDNKEAPIEYLRATTDTTPEDLASRSSELQAAKAAAKKLPLIQRKILKMKGIIE